MCVTLRSELGQMRQNPKVGMKQRGLNDLTRARLSKRSYDSDSTPRPPFSPLSRELNKLEVASLSQSSCVSSVELTDGRGDGGGGGGAESYDHKKAWPCINH